ncbi:MAG: O-antigen ligase family protein, partial [Kiritimatiellaeota bacterium]|nr:O-antigen ligase family protein [Kiritimatiellota bacterium]
AGPLMLTTLLGAALVFSRPLIWAEARADVRVPPAGAALLLFLLYGWWAIFFCATPFEARIEFFRAGSFLAAYWAWTNLVERNGRWRWILGLFLLTVSLIAWYGIIQHLTGQADRVLWFNRQLEGSSYGPRVGGTYFCPNHFAHLLALAATMGLALVFTPEAGVFLRLLGAYTLLVVLPAQHFSQSRAGWIGLATGLAVTTLALVYRRSRAWFWVLLIAMPFLLAGGAAAYWRASPAFRERFLEAKTEAQNVTIGGEGGFRVNQWRDTLPMIKDRPAFGHGPGSYRWLAEEYRRHMKFANRLAEYAHNDYLQTLAEYGWVGTLLLALPLLWLLLRMLRALGVTRNLNNAGLLAGLLGAWAASFSHALFDFNLRIFANVMALVLLTGVVVGRLQARREWKRFALTRRQAWLLCGPALLLTLLLGAAVARTLAAYAAQVRGDYWLRRFAYERAERLEQRAVRLDPANWHAWSALGQIYQTRSFWSPDEQQKLRDSQQALLCYQAARRGNPRDMDNVYGAAMSELALDRPEQGLRLLRAAADSHPFNQNYRTQFALQLRQAGRYAEALAEFKKVERLGSTPMIRMNLKWLNEQAKGGRR